MKAWIRRNPRDGRWYWYVPGRNLDQVISRFIDEVLHARVIYDRDEFDPDHINHGAYGV